MYVWPFESQAVTEGQSHGGKGRHTLQYADEVTSNWTRSVYASMHQFSREHTHQLLDGCAELPARKPPGAVAVQFLYCPIAQIIIAERSSHFMRFAIVSSTKVRTGAIAFKQALWLPPVNFQDETEQYDVMLKKIEMRRVLPGRGRGDVW